MAHVSSACRVQGRQGRFSASSLGGGQAGSAIPVMAKLAGRGLASDSGPGKPALGRAAFLGDHPAGPRGPPCPVLDLDCMMGP